MSNTSAGRVELPPVEAMTPVQRRLYDEAVKGLGGPIGPGMALLVSPDVALKWRELRLSLNAIDVPKRLSELAILVLAREWMSQFEWWAHEPRARAQGLSTEVIAALKAGRIPSFTRADEAAAYAYCVELLRTHMVSDATYAGLRDFLGSKGVVEFTAFLGHYANVAMTLAAHRIPLPADVELPLVA